MKEKRVNIEAKENVIDKLLAWESLTSEEEILRTEIIKERTEIKIKREEEKIKMEVMKTIFEKKRSWESLTEDDENKLENFLKNRRNFIWDFRRNRR
jgi:Cft2 family RNA processing exonuclease